MAETLKTGPDAGEVKRKELRGALAAEIRWHRQQHDIYRRGSKTMTSSEAGYFAQDVPDHFKALFHVAASVSLLRFAGKIYPRKEQRK